MVGGGGVAAGGGALVRVQMEGRGLAVHGVQMANLVSAWSLPTPVSITNSDTRSQPRHIMSLLQNHLLGEFVNSKSPSFSKIVLIYAQFQPYGKCKQTYCPILD